jgi:hypothetical protein
MKLPDKKQLLNLYSDNADQFILNFEDYLENNNKTSELKYYIRYGLLELFSIITGYDGNKKLLVQRLKRNKKQTITHCLELLSIEWDKNVLGLMNKISNKKHCWKIVQDKKLKYSWDFIDGIFMG